MKQSIFFFIVVIVFLLACTDVRAQGHKEDIFNFSPDTTAGCSNSFIYPEQNYFFAAGQAEVDSNSSLTAYIAKYGYNLHIQKTKYLPFAGLYNRCWGLNNGIAKISNNRYVFVGIEQDDHTNSRVEVAQPYLYFFDSNLRELGYGKYIDTVRSRYPYSIAIDKQKNVLLCGFIESKELHLNSWDHFWYPDSSSLWVAKYDSTGIMIWQKAYNTLCDTAGSPTAFRILLGNDSISYIIAGQTTVTPSMAGNFIMKIDTSGKEIWTSYLPRPYITMCNIDLARTGNSGYAFVSSYSINPGPTGSYDAPYFYYGRIKENGDTLWTKLFRNCNCSTYGNAIYVTDNKDFLLLGTHDDTSSRPTLIRTDSNGNVKWYREYYYRHPLLESDLVGFALTPSTQILLCGQFTNKFLFPGVMDSVGSWSLFMLTDTFGCMEDDCQAADTVWRGLDVPTMQMRDIKIDVYPNPMQEQLYIQSGAVSEGSEAVLMDISGRRLYAVKLKANTKEEIDVGILEPGLYLLQVWENGQIVKTYKVSKAE